MIKDGDDSRIITHKSTIEDFIIRLVDAEKRIKNGDEKGGLEQIVWVKHCLDNLANGSSSWILSDELKSRMSKEEQSA